MDIIDRNIALYRLEKLRGYCSGEANQAIRIAIDVIKHIEPVNDKK